MLLAQQLSFPKFPDLKKASRPLVGDFVFIKQGTAFHKVRIEDILYLECDNVYIYIHTSQKKYLVRSTINQYLELLNTPLFFRVHRSFAVNIAHVTTIDLHFVTINSTSIPVSKTFRNELLNQLKLG